MFVRTSENKAIDDPNVHKEPHGKDQTDGTEDGEVGKELLSRHGRHICRCRNGRQKGTFHPTLYISANTRTGSDMRCWETIIGEAVRAKVAGDI